MLDRPFAGNASDSYVTKYSHALPACRLERAESRSWILHTNNAPTPASDICPLWNALLASGDKLDLLETLLDISLPVRENHTLGLWNLPAREFLLEVVKHTQETKLQLFEQYMINIQLEKNLLDKGAPTAVAAVHNFITVVVLLRASEFGMDWTCSPSNLYQFRWTIDRLLGVHNNRRDGEVGELGKVESVFAITVRVKAAKIRATN